MTRPLAPLRGDARAAFTENETNFRRLFGAREPEPLRQGRHQRLRRPRHGRCRQPRSARHQGVGALPVSGRSRPDGDRPAAARGSADPAAGAAFGPDFDGLVATRLAEADEFYDELASRPMSGDDERRIQRQSLRGPALEQAVLSLRRHGAGCDGDPAGPEPPRERRRRAQPRVDAPAQRRSALDARQVGVPVVRRLGPRVPLPSRSRSSIRTSPSSSCCCCCASGTCTPTASCPRTNGTSRDVNPPVHAWAAWQRLQDRAEAVRAQRSPVPRARVPQAAAELHVVGEPEGSSRGTTSSRAASSVWTTSASSIAAR